MRILLLILLAAFVLERAERQKQASIMQIKTTPTVSTVGDSLIAKKIYYEANSH